MTTEEIFAWLATAPRQAVEILAWKAMHDGNPVEPVTHSDTVVDELLYDLDSRALQYAKADDARAHDVMVEALTVVSQAFGKPVHPCNCTGKAKP